MRLFIVLWALLQGLAGTVVAAAEEPLPREVMINEVEFVLVPEGWFWFSVPTARSYDVKSGDPLERDVRVWLDGYYIGKYEARARDLETFLNTGKSNFVKQYGGSENGCAVRADPEGRFYRIDPKQDMPATQLSWELADEFSRWMGFRLPTEAEWEKAARGTDKRHWPWGADYPDDTYAGFFGPTRCNPTPVDAFPKGRSPYGAYNMAGNVWEYVADWYNADYYNGIKDGMRNPVPPSDGTVHPDIYFPNKVLKGGRWASDPAELTLHSRTTTEPHQPFLCFGARFAVDVATVKDHLRRGSARVLSP